MVGMMATSSRDEVDRLLNSIKYSINVETENMQRLRELLLHEDPSLIPEFLFLFLELHEDRFSQIRKPVTEMIGEIGVMYTELIPEMMPILIALLEDDTPQVARQAVTSGSNLFCSTLENVAIQGLHSSELDDSLESSWKWMLKFKDSLCPVAFQPGNDGVRASAVKFLESMVLLYTPDPNGSSESPPNQACVGKSGRFDISWLRGGHPLLNVGDLSIEASQTLGLMLDQLRFPKVKSLTNSMTIVFIKSLSAIAKKRPTFYGRILPVLLGLNTSRAVMEGVRVPSVHHNLKNAFLSCLNCTNPGAAPWRDRLVTALKEIKVGIEDGTPESHFVKEEENTMKACDVVEVDTGRKRSLVQDTNNLDDNNMSGKRSRPTSVASDLSDANRKLNSSQSGLPLIGSTSCSGEGDNGPVQQLVAMFGALAAQGEKAQGSLNILIASISADLLAEVVMANMRYLPLTHPKAEEDEESTLPSISGSKTLGQGAATLASVFPQLASLFAGQPSASHDVPEHDLEDEQPDLTVSDIACVPVNSDVTEAMVPADFLTSDIIVPPGIENGSSAILSNIHDLGTPESEIPGLDSIHNNEVKELDATHLASINLSGSEQEQITSLDLLDIPSSCSVPTDRSEELSPKIAVSDANSVPSTTPSTLTTSQYILPKMAAPVVNITDNQKDHLQNSAFVRIVEGFKQISIAGGSHVRSSLLAHLGVEYPLDLDPWKFLQQHILSDYLNHEGHELTLRVLYRLFREAEQENDFFSSTTATSVYETFLLIVAESLRDSFPASDKSLSRLLCEVPYIPKSAFKLLENLCSPGSSDKIDKELQNGDRVTQGLSAVWSLILLRPPIRDVCLKIALQSAVHHLEEVRMKAIRLVANKLYPISSITKQIEDFASEMLLSVINSSDVEGTGVVELTTEAQKDSSLEKPSSEQLLPSTALKEASSDTNQPCSTPSISPSSMSETQRHMSLYFALCTKKHSLFRQVFVIYKSIPKAVTQVVHRQIPILVRTIGSSSELLSIISDPPTGSESLLMQVLHILTDGTIPSPELISTVKRLYDSKIKDVDILIPILPSLPKDEMVQIFPQLLNLPVDKFQSALACMLQGSSHSSIALSPAEVLIAIHGIDPDRDGIPLKKVTDACNACFEQRQVFTQQVLAKVLNQLVEQTPLPLLFMRTVLQTIGAFPALVDFIMEILSRLVTKQIWKYPKLWVGFLKCAFMTKPHSFSVLLQLPAAQLENALNRTAALKPPLITHATQPNIRSTLPRSTLVVLGIVSDSQTASQSKTTPSQMAENSNSGIEGGTEKTKDSSTAT